MKPSLRKSSIKPARFRLRKKNVRHSYKVRTGIIHESVIDNIYNGHYVAVLFNDALFSEGNYYVIAVGKKTDEVFHELSDLVFTMKKNSRFNKGTVKTANKNRNNNEDLYVTFIDN